MSSIIPAPEIPFITSLGSPPNGLTVSSGELSLSEASPGSAGAMAGAYQQMTGPLDVTDGLLSSGDTGTPGGLVNAYINHRGRVNAFCHKIEVGFSAFDGNGGVSDTISLWDFSTDGPSLIKIERVIAVVNTPFAGDPSDLTCEVGIMGDTNCFLESFSCYTDPGKGATLADSGAAISGGDYPVGSPIDMVAKFDVTGFTLGDLNQGSLVIYIEGKSYF